MNNVAGPSRAVTAVVFALLMMTSPVAGSVALVDESGQAATSSNIDAEISFFNHESGSYEEGETVSGEVKVRNTGDVEHTFFVGYSVVGPDGEYYDNNGQTGKTVTLAPGERTWVSLSWTVESDAPTGTFDAVTSVWEERDRDNLYTRLANKKKEGVFEVVEPTTIDAELFDVGLESGDFTTGESVDAQAVVENTGTTEHTYFVGYAAIGPDGNYYENDGETGYTVTIGPGDSRYVDLSWSVQSEAPAGSYDARVSVWKESDRDNLYTRLASEQQSNVFDVVEPTNIDADLRDVTVESGQFETDDTVTARALVENTGNTDHTYFVGYSAIGPDGTYYENNGETGQTVTLSPGEDRSVTLNWEVQSDAPSGTYDARISVWEESDRDNLYTRLDDSVTSGAFEVAEPTTIDAELRSFEVASGQFKPESNVDAQAVVENTGNTEHTFFVGFAAIGPHGDFYENNGQTGTTVTIAPGERRYVDLHWSVQSDAPEGSYDARVSVWRESDRDNLYTRLATGQKSGVFDVVEPTNIDATLRDIGIESGTFQTGDTVSARVTVENTGNTEHTYFVGYSAIGPVGTYYENDGETGQTVTLDAGEERSLVLRWQVQEDATEGIYDARISVWKENDRDNLQTRLDNWREESAFEVTKPTNVDAQLHEVRVESGQFTAGETVSASAIVENTGNTEHTFFVGYSAIDSNGNYYENDGGTGDTVTLEPGERRSIALQWQVNSDVPPGEYDVRLSVWRESDREQLETRVSDVRRSSVFEIEPQTGVLEGVVVNATGSTIDAATVEIADKTVETAGNGRFRVEDVPYGTYELQVSHPSYRTVTESVTISEDQSLIEVELKEPPVEIQVSPPSTYAKDEPVEVGVVVSAQVETESTFTVTIPEREGMTVTGTRQKTITLTDFVTAKHLTFTVSFSERRESQPVTARVQTVDGAVLGTASYSLSPSQTELVVHATSTEGESVSDVELELLNAGMPEKTTNGDGTATFSGLVGGEYILLATAPERDTYPSKEIEVTAGERNHVSVELPAQATFEGEVWTESEPIGDATIHIDGRQQRVTDQGSFRFGEEFETGRYQITITKNGETIVEEEKHLHPGRNTYRFTVSSDDVAASEVSASQSEEVDRVDLIGTDNGASVEAGDKGLVLAGMGSDLDPASDSLWYSMGESGEFWTTDGGYYTSGPCAFYHDSPSVDDDFRQEMCDQSSTEGHPDIMAEGVYNGFATGAGESVQGVKDTINAATHPVEATNEFIRFGLKIAQDLGLLEEIISALPESIKEQQREDNLYPEGTSEYRSFKSGWYGGYGSYIITTTLATGGASKAISSSSKMGSIASKFESLSDSKQRRILRNSRVSGAVKSAFPDDVPVSLIDSDLDTGDIQSIKQRFDIAKTEAVVKRSDLDDQLRKSDSLDEFENSLGSTSNVPNTIVLNTDGWDHVKDRHVPQYMSYDELESPTDAFPTGGNVGGTSIPNKMTEDEVKEVIYNTVNDPDTVDYDGAIRYTRNPDVDGVEKVRVVVDPDSGRIISAYPMEGEAVKPIYPD